MPNLRAILPFLSANLMQDAPIAANPVFAACGTTIFEVMSRLAADHGAVNLGQGYPEGLEPAFLIEAAVEALTTGGQQYPPMMGLPVLRQAVAAHDRRFYGLDLDWQNEVMVTSGATEALADCLFGLIRPGDGVVVLEPMYDSYLPIIRRAGGVPRLIRLAPPDWRLPREALAAAFAPDTRLLLLNSPMNPTGKVFDLDDLSFIATLLVRHRAIAVCDEVYEHLVYQGHRHIPLISLPGMRHCCLRIGSAGKSFSVTGWKVGYVVAAPPLLQPVARAHQYITFTTPPALQQAVAVGLASGDDYYLGLIRDLSQKRDFLAAGLDEIGLTVHACHGSYFLIADISATGFTDDFEFCRHLTVAAGVAAVPVSAFFEADGPRHYARFCFAKRQQTLDQAMQRLRHAAAVGVLRPPA
jgi:aspartate/methionine/tyrosine aminotransferase